MNVYILVTSLRDMSLIRRSVSLLSCAVNVLFIELTQTVSPFLFQETFSFLSFFFFLSKSSTDIEYLSLVFKLGLLWMLTELHSVY